MATDTLCGGHQALTRAPLRAQICETSFGFYSAEQIRKLSVVSITSQEAFDRMGNPIPGGLNDPRLGPIDHNEVCPTCGFTGRMCTGHLGHVELPLPIFHPLLMDHLLLLLQSQCAHCYKLRVPEKEKRVVHLQQLGIRRLVQQGLARGWEAWLDAYLVYHRRKRLLLGAGARL